MDSFRCHADFQEDVFPIAAFISLNLQNHETHCCCPNETAAVANYDSHPDCWINVCSLSENVSNSCLKEETFFGARGNLRMYDEHACIIPIDKTDAHRFSFNTNNQQA